jgi:hypothetical protein
VTRGLTNSQADGRALNDGHHALIFEAVEAVEEKSEFGGELGDEAMFLETHVVSQRFRGFTAVIGVSLERFY